jgi:lipocalin
MRRIAPTCALTVLLGFGHALAAAPQPSKPVAVGMYFGRWYQIAQIAKINRNRCPGATDDFSSSPGGGFVVLVTCHESSGDSHQIRAKVSIIQGSGAAKFKMSFFGGLISRPVLDGPVRAVAFARISALGYDTSRLIASR